VVKQLLSERTDRWLNTQSEKEDKMKNGRRKRRHRKEVMAMFAQFKEKFPASVREEIVAEGVHFTLARVSATMSESPGVIVGEGIARRSGDSKIQDEPNSNLGRSISLGRANVACAIKLASHKPWVKIRSLLMA
jgi:hypothetical protein